MEVIGNKGVIYEFGKFVLDPHERTLFADGVPIHLRAKEFDTLLLLVQHNGRALTKEEMMSAVWHGSFVEESNLAKQISRLRKIFNTNGDTFIETIPKHGYRFRAEIQCAVLEPEAPLVVTKRTVKRLRVEFDDGADAASPPLALPPARHWSVTAFRIALIALIVAVGLGLLAFYLSRNTVPIIDPYAPMRLTDNPNDDTGPSWTTDGRILFSRIFPDNHVETWVMLTDGSGQEPLRMPDGKRIISWSPDGRKAQYQKN